MKRFFNNLFRTKTPTIRKSAFRPQFEALEDRRLMTYAFLNSGILNVIGTEEADTITFRQRNGVISIDGFGPTFQTGTATVNGPGVRLGVGPAGNGVINLAQPWMVQAIIIQGLGGGDTINLNTAGLSGSVTYDPITVGTAIFGGAGNDTVDGGAGRDFIFGEADADKLYGRGNSDRLEGGAGNDSLYGSGGGDVYAFVGGTLGTDLVEEPSTNGGPDRLDFSQFIGAVGVDLALTTNQTVRTGHLVVRLSNETLIEEVIGSAFSDSIRGNSQNNRLEGLDGYDTMLGLDGDDVLLGGRHSDSLFGGSDKDELHGGAGNDSLFGEGSADLLVGDEGSDSLDGGAGDDGLFGGWGNDTVRGGTGDDRFLSWENASNSLGFRYDPDTLSDVNWEDAKIKFQDTTSPHVRDGGEWGYDDDITYTTKAWTAAEIEDVDKAFALLHERTGNTRLLETSMGSELKFVRVGSPNKNDGGAAGANTMGTIDVFDLAFSNGFTPLMETVIHEIGHNWDTENPSWQAFRDLSIWTQANMDGMPNFTKTVAYGETWYFMTGTAFASNYAATHPEDDFAESFAKYFVDRAGLTWTRGGSAIPAKLNLIDGWLNSID